MANLTAAQIAGYASKAGWTGQDLVTAVAVALAESSGNPSSTNQNTDSHRSVDYGLWQVNNYWNADEFTKYGGNWSDPATNAKMAFDEWKQHGWNDWVTYKTGAYRKYLSQAQDAAKNPSSGSNGGGGISDILHGIGNTIIPGLPGGDILGGGGSSLLGPLKDIAKGIVDFAGQIVKDFGFLEHFFFALFKPSTYVRALSGLFGFLFVLVGIFLLGREMRHS